MAPRKTDQSVEVGSVTIRCEIKLPVDGIQYSSKTAEISVTRPDTASAQTEFELAFEYLNQKLSLVRAAPEPVDTSAKDEEIAQLKARVEKGNAMYSALSADPLIASKMKEILTPKPVV